MNFQRELTQAQYMASMKLLVPFMMIYIPAICFGYLLDYLIERKKKRDSEGE